MKQLLGIKVKSGVIMRMNPLANCQNYDIMVNMTTIEKQLRQAVRKSGMSIKAMSDQSKIPYAAVHGFVRDDERTVTLRTAAKLAELLQLELRPIRRRKGR